MRRLTKAAKHQFLRGEELATILKASKGHNCKDGYRESTPAGPDIRTLKLQYQKALRAEQKASVAYGQAICNRVESFKALQAAGVKLP